MMTSPQNFEQQAPVHSQAEVLPRCVLHDCDMERITPAHVPATDNKIDYVCARCAEISINRATVKSHQQFDQARALDAHQRKQAELEKRLGRAGIPARYQDLSFDTFPGRSQESLKHCSTLRSYANQFRAMKEQGISVLLVGRAGTGKTGLACCIANVVIRDHKGTAFFTSAYGAVRHMRDTWGRRGRTETEALQDLLDPDLLVLDEVGSSVGTDAETASLFEVINGRYQARKPTILLSNLPMDDWTEPGGGKRAGLRTYLGDRVVDRFRDDGSFTLAFDWPSLRGAA